MKRIIVGIFLLVFHFSAFGQNELSRLSNETLWYILEEKLASYHVILASQTCEYSINSGAKSKGYDGAAMFTLYDAITDKEDTINLLYRIDTYNTRVNLYSDDTERRMLFYVKFRSTNAYLYVLQPDSGTYKLGKILPYVDINAMLNSNK